MIDTMKNIQGIWTKILYVDLKYYVGNINYLSWRYNKWFIFVGASTIQMNSLKTKHVGTTKIKIKN